MSQTERRVDAGAVALWTFVVIEAIAIAWVVAAILSRAPQR